MTNEEALNILERQIECDNDNCPEPGMSCSECPYNVDAIDYARARKMAIEALDKQCASTEQAAKDIKFPTIHCCRGYDCIKDESGRMGFGVYDPQEKNIYIAGDVPKEIFLKALFHEVFHWVQDVAGMKFNEDDANSFSDILYDAVDMFDDHGPGLFGQKTIVEPGEVFVGQNVLNDVLDQSAQNDEAIRTDDHIADDSKMVKLQKRTITERLIIAQSLIEGVIFDSSNQFRDSTKKTEDVPDMNVGKIDFKPDLMEKLTRYEPEVNATTDKVLIDLAEAIEIVKFECGEWKGLAQTIVNGLKKLPPKQSEKIPYKKPEIIYCKDCLLPPNECEGTGWFKSDCSFHSKAERRNDG